LRQPEIFSSETVVNSLGHEGVYLRQMIDSGIRQPV
jgi:hypothetical protein